MFEQFECDCSWTGSAPKYDPKATLAECLRCPECGRRARLTQKSMEALNAAVDRELEREVAIRLVAQQPVRIRRPATGHFDLLDTHKSESQDEADVEHDDC